LHIEYTIPERSKVRIAVYDMLGKMIDILDERTMDAGSYTIVWNAEHQAKGSYLLKMTSKKSSITKHLILIK
jgi:hypothetical protein